jgi:hypothetical protein
VPPRGRTGGTAAATATAAAKKKKLRHQDAAKAAMSRSLVQFERVTSQAALEDDLHQASSLFVPDTAATHATRTAAATASSTTGDMDDLSDGSQVLHQASMTGTSGDPRGLAAVVGSPSKAHGLTRSGPMPQSYLSLPGYVIPVDEDGSSVASSMAGLASSPKPLSGKSLLNSSQVLWQSSQDHDGLRAMMSSTYSTDRETAESGGPKNTTTVTDPMSPKGRGDSKTPSKGKASTRVLPVLTSVRGSHSAGQRTQPSHPQRTVDSPKRPTKDYVELNRAVRPVDAFKETHRCHYPGCNQVFSRNYTYKVHLKTHEVFPQYHEYKNNPQLLLDTVL